MEDSVLPSPKQRSPDHRFSIPERPRKAPALPITSPCNSTPKLVGHEELHRLNEDARVSSHNHNSEDPCEFPAVASINDTSEQTDKLPSLARHVEQVLLSPDRERFTPERLLVLEPVGSVAKRLKRRW